MLVTALYARPHKHPALQSRGRQPGRGQVGVYFKIARDMAPYRMIITQEGKVDNEIEEYMFEKVRYAVVRINELQTIRIEELKGDS